MRELRSFSELKNGIPRGVLTEVCGPKGTGNTERLLRILAGTPGERLAWVEEELTIYPRALPQRGLSLSRVLFVEAGRNVPWAVRQILSSRLFGAVVVSSESLAEIELRRLQIAAKQAQAAVILLSENPVNAGAWTIFLRVQTQNPSNFQRKANI